MSGRLRERHQWDEIDSIQVLDKIYGCMDSRLGHSHFKSFQVLRRRHGFRVCSCGTQYRCRNICDGNRLQAVLLSTDNCFSSQIPHFVPHNKIFVAKYFNHTSPFYILPIYDRQIEVFQYLSCWESSSYAWFEFRCWISNRMVNGRVCKTPITMYICLSALV